METVDQILLLIFSHSLLCLILSTRQMCFDFWDTLNAHLVQINVGLL